MAELLIRIIDRPTSDGSKRGDVIAVGADGHGWSLAELTNPLWRIVRVPVTETEVAAFLRPRLTDGIVQRYRDLIVDVDSPQVPAALAQFIADNTRQTPVFDLDAATIRKLRASRV